MKITQPDVVAASQYMDIPAVLDAQAQIGPAVTAFVGAEPVACFGAYKIWHGLAEAWMIADDAARYRPVQLTKIAAIFMDIVTDALRLHRLQMTVKVDDNRAVRWAQVLGFGIEGELKRYAPDGSNFYMMAR